MMMCKRKDKAIPIFSSSDACLLIIYLSICWETWVPICLPWPDLQLSTDECTAYIFILWVTSENSPIYRPYLARSWDLSATPVLHSCITGKDSSMLWVGEQPEIRCVSPLLSLVIFCVYLCTWGMKSCSEDFGGGSCVTVSWGDEICYEKQRGKSHTIQTMGALLSREGVFVFV